MISVKEWIPVAKQLEIIEGDADEDRLCVETDPEFQDPPEDDS